MKNERLLNAIGQIDDKLIAEALPEVGVKKPQVAYRRILALAACVVLLLCVAVITPVALGNRVAGTVTMEINPRVEYTITANGNVQSVRFLNDDAKYALDELSLKNQSLIDAVTLTVAAYKTSGYMERNDTVLISFDKKLSENEKLKETVSENIRTALAKTKAVHTLVYVTATDNDHTADIAEKHNISQGKAKLIADATKNSDLSVEDLVRLPLDELVALQKEADSVIIDSEYIGIFKAKEIALKDAGSVARVEFTEARLINDGALSPYYKLTYDDGQRQRTYRIDAKDGSIIEKIETEIFIPLEDAVSIALKDAGIGENFSSENVIFTEKELNRNQGRPCWILKFYTEKYQYSYKIDAKTGEIIFFDYRIDVRGAKEIALKDAKVNPNVERITFTVEDYVGGGIKTPYYYFVFNNETTQWAYRIDATLGIVLEKKEIKLSLSLQNAKDIAIKDAEITDSEEVTFTEEELEHTADRPCWVLKFYTEKYQYVYKIDAKTDEIIYSRRYINVSEAKKIAIKNSGYLAKVDFTKEELIDGEIKTPYFYLVFNNDTTQWTYRINATDGTIISSTKEPIALTK